MEVRRNGVLGIWLLGFGYFACYVPYAALVRVLAQGLLPGLGPVPGLELLPAMALGTLAGTSLFLVASGWWRHAGGPAARDRRVGWPRREAIDSAFWTALIIGATTLNYTFAGVSILLMLLLMRAGTLVLSPLVDLWHGQPVRWYAWSALALSLVAAAVALADVDSYQLPAAAVGCLALYFGGYAGRFHAMRRGAKHPEPAVNRRFFVEEHLAAAPILVLLLLGFALVGAGDAMLALRRGFTTFWTSEAAPLAFLSGLLYEALFVFGTLIYLDRREYTYSVPINRASSLIAGVVASALLGYFLAQPLPSDVQLASVGLILVAVAFLVLPPLREQRRLRLLERTLQRVFLFVCSGNRLRSPMAAAICNAEIARRLHIPWADVHHASVRAISAGTRVAEAKPFKAGVRDALRRLGVPATAHTSQPLTAELVADADVVFCMTADLRSEVVAIAPSAAHKVLCLDPNGADVEEPAPGAPESLAECARRLQLLVRGRLDESDLGTHRLRPALEEGLP